MTDSSRFDWISPLFAPRRMSRRQTLASTGMGLAAAVAGLTAPDATPAAGLADRALVQESTPMALPVPTTVGLGRLVFEDPEFDAQLLRALDTIPSGGADFGECLVTARRIAPGDQASWWTEWKATADRVYASAEASRAAGHFVSAREAYLRAVTYYRTSSVFLFRPPLDPTFVDSFERQRDSFQRAAELGEQRIETVKIPYEKTTLEGYFATASGVGPHPTLVMVDGYDGTKEEMLFAGGAAALLRGYNILLVDGPGQGGALIEQGLVFRPDWEAVVTPQIDWLLARPESDPKRIALIGRSWGGYLAPRAAAAEHRIAALIADAAQYAPGKRGVLLLPPEFRDQLKTGDDAALNNVLEEAMAQSPFLDFAINRGLLTHGFATPIDFVRGIAKYTLEGLADRISCPTLICEAENDVRGGDAKPLYDAIEAPKKYMLFTNSEGAGEHDEAGAASLFAQRVFDWLDETLAAIPGN